MAKAQWTFMVYLAGDNNLSDAGDTDLEEMRAVGSSPQVNVVAQFDNSGDGTQRFLIQKGSGKPVQTLGETDSGDPKVLLDFVRWAAKKYPAERYALILWNHGGGWAPGDLDRIARGVKSPRYSARELSQRMSSRLGRTFFRTSLEKIFRLKSPAERAICSDDGSGHSLDTLELGKVLEKAVKALKQPLDLLGMDACLMSNIEVLYQVRPYVSYAVGSLEEEPNQGWPYSDILSRLVAQPGLSAPELAQHIVSSYIASYKRIREPSPVTQSAFDLARIDQAAGPLDALAQTLTRQMSDKVAFAIGSAQRRSSHFFDGTLWDIGHFSAELAGQSQGAIKQAAQELVKALAAGPDKFVLAAQTYAGLEKTKGLSVYLPILGISRFYQDLDFAQKTHWLKLLEAYHQA